MATDGSQAHSRLIPIAAAPIGVGGSPNLGAYAAASQYLMQFTCQMCAKRKVKCDKLAPTCSSCRKGGLDCFYQAPLPRSRKRKPSDEIYERLARYERILSQHGLLDAEAPPPIPETPSQGLVSRQWSEPAPSGDGKLLSGEGRSRYIDSSLWRNLGDDEMHRISDDEEDEGDEAVTTLMDMNVASDPLTGAFLGSQRSISHYHPSHGIAMHLWKTHAENVEPLCKILHLPSTHKMVETASQQPEKASRAEECLLFAIYHFAVYSMTDEECCRKMGESRAPVLRRYHLAMRQAFVNASFLKTTEMSVLQALVLFLLSCRSLYDSQTFWILTGVAVRIAQRMGIHRDGDKLGLPPLEVQMRRRLFYQLLPLDGVAGQMSGAGIPVLPPSWDTQPPLNISDDQIWPGMIEVPQEQRGATNMIFCLSRSCVGRSIIRLGKLLSSADSEFKGHIEADVVISEAESEVEEKYIRYCDIVNPLHFLTIGLARAGLTFMRLRVRLPKVRTQTATDAELREAFQLAEKILDTDAAAHSHTGLSKYRWYVQPFYLWGMWDSLILVLTTLWKRTDLLSPAATDAAWNRVEQVYLDHDEFLESKRSVHVAFGRLALKAWDATYPQMDGIPEPGFITTLRAIQMSDRRSRRKAQSSNAGPHGNDAVSADLAPVVSTTTPMDSVSGDAEIETDSNFDLENADWVFWDQLVQDYQAQGGG